MTDPRPLSSTETKRLHRAWRRRQSGRVALLLDHVDGPYNVGAITRTAAAMRVERVWLLGDGPAPDDERTQKTAMGTQRFLDWSRAADAGRAAEEIEAAGLRLVGVELASGASPLHELDLDDVCLAVGHEHRGLSAAVLSRCSAVGFVPQLGRVGSLNVATAAALAVYEARRQAWTAGGPTS